LESWGRCRLIELKKLEAFYILLEKLAQLRQNFLQALMFRADSAGCGHYSFYGCDFPWQRRLVEVQSLIDQPMFGFGAAAQAQVAAHHPVLLFDIVFDRESLVG
jgi:hypothetical protein